MKTTTRTHTAELRAAPGEAGYFTALATTWGLPYDIGGGKREQMARGAFRSAVEPVPIYASHDHQTGGVPIGTSTDIRETPEGLLVDGRLFLDASERARATYEAMRSGALRAVSVGFIPRKTRSLPGNVVEIVEAELIETSIVLRGAHPGARLVDVRSGYGDRAPCPELVEAYISDDAEFRDFIEDALL